MRLDRPPSRVLDEPKPGFYLMRVVRKGPLVPAAIFHEFDTWRAEINGVVQGNPHQDPLLADKVCAVWNTYRQVITREEYYTLVRRAADPANPMSRPDQPVDLSQRPRF